MRLKFDRLINITMEVGNVTIVPEGELWKYSVSVGAYTNFQVNGTQLEKNLFNGHASEGCRFTLESGSSVAFQAIAFKVVKE